MVTMRWKAHEEERRHENLLIATPRSTNWGILEMKCANCGSEVPRFSGLWEVICPQCGRRYPSLRSLLILLMVGLFAAIAELMAVYINTRYDFIGIIGAVLLWVFVAIVALDIVVLHRRRKSLPLTREESVSK